MSDATIRRPGLLRRVVVLADESANWKIAGLRQLDRLALTLQEFASAKQPNEQIEVCVVWNSEFRAAVRNDSRLENLTIKNGDTAEIATDLVLSTRQLLYRGSVAQLLALPNGKSADGNHNLVCAYLGSPRDIAACERRFLEQNGKSQDGLVSRHVNRRGSRWLSRWLLKLPIAPTLWSAVIFILPILASFAFLRGTYLGFVIGAAIFQVYSIVDGCDGEIARAKFMQTEFGRRFDSLCDLVGNVLLAVTLGFGLARQANSLTNASWFYAAEGIAAAMLILTS
ncbi:MAG TPA: CDP-alcohol phosphatidyltransferase family protein, partial [Chthoniobacterales bacterium]